MGFEPTRAEHNGLAVHRLNHSATPSHDYTTLIENIYLVERKAGIVCRIFNTGHYFLQGW